MAILVIYYIHELSKETVHTSGKPMGPVFSLQGAQVPSMQMSQMAGPAAGYQWNPGVGNLGTEPVELSWKRPVFRGWKLQTS